MSELSGLELRKALCEALGWKLWNYEQDRYAESADDVEDAFNNDGWTWKGMDLPEEAWEFKPEADPGAFWPAFEEWCGSDWLYAHVRHRDGRHIFSIGNDSQASPLFVGRGSSGTEAGCRAWVEALQTINVERSNSSRSNHRAPLGRKTKAFKALIKP